MLDVTNLCCIPLLHSRMMLLFLLPGDSNNDGSGQHIAMVPAMMPRTALPAQMRSDWRRCTTRAPTCTAGACCWPSWLRRSRRMTACT